MKKNLAFAAAVMAGAMMSGSGAFAESSRSDWPERTHRPIYGPDAKRQAIARRKNRIKNKRAKLSRRKNRGSK